MSQMCYLQSGLVAESLIDEQREYLGSLRLSRPHVRSGSLLGLCKEHHTNVNTQGIKSINT